MKLAIIPARGGSKRIARKNIKRFAGKPMIAYAIEAALACDVIDRVIVSTEDDEIADIAARYGADRPFARPASLADDTTPTVPVIAHALEAVRDQGWSVEFACCIYPGVPFLRSADLAAAFELLQRSDGRGYTFPVAEFPSPIQRALKRDAAGALAPFQPEHTLTRTQDLEPAYYDAGQFYWATAQTWLAGLDIHSNAHAIVLPALRAIDIDTPEDWDKAEAVFTSLALAG